MGVEVYRGRGVKEGRRSDGSTAYESPDGQLVGFELCLI